MQAGRKRISTIFNSNLKRLIAQGTEKAYTYNRSLTHTVLFLKLNGIEINNMRNDVVVF